MILQPTYEALSTELAPLIEDPKSSSAKAIQLVQRILNELDKAEVAQLQANLAEYPVPEAGTADSLVHRMILRVVGEAASQKPAFDREREAAASAFRKALLQSA